MAYIIGRVRDEVSVPFGVDILKKRINETLKRNIAAAIDPLSNIHTSKN
jgi:predicted TIM-barrel enzyme